MNTTYQIAIRQLVSQFYKNIMLSAELNQMSNCVSIDWDQLPPLSDQVSANINTCGIVSSQTDIDDWFLSQISGSKVSELMSCNNITPHMLFLLSRHLTSDDAVNNYESFNIEYANLSNQFLYDSLDKFNVNTMAFEDKWQYSPYNHNHDRIYSKVNITNMHSSQDAIMATIALSDDHFNPKSVINITYPIIQLQEPAEPDIGELRFCASPSLTTNININSDNFDGWVYANGAQYTNVDRTRFTKALAAYGTTNNSFTVPNITSFFRLCGLGNDNVNTITPQQIGLKYHTHHVYDLSVTGQLRYDSTDQNPKITTADDTSPGYHYHHGQRETKEVKFESTIDYSKSPIIGFKTKLAGVNTAPIPLYNGFTLTTTSIIQDKNIYPSNQDCDLYGLNLIDYTSNTIFGGRPWTSACDICDAVKITWNNGIWTLYQSTYVTQSPDWSTVNPTATITKPIDTLELDFGVDIYPHDVPGARKLVRSSYIRGYSENTVTYYPTHHKIPIMVYIGGRKKPYKSSGIK